ncbi:MAG TPA: chemotaxis protein CheW [Verrucomicrobiota bacterium]|nr:chemotaxis protein CheW [Verrucomicrobiales bacterium]HRI14088.1 chemotaxis protein CheW [Verrucomicrobiota bacterium]
MTPDTSSPPAFAAKPGKYLTFSLGRESYGVPVLSVREIIRLCPITPVPKMPRYIKGVINLRGKVIPILDLRAKFGLASESYADRACIMVIQVGQPPNGGTLMGAIVDAVEEVVPLAATDLESTPDFGGSPDTQYILGMATVRGGVKTLLNLEKIFQEDGTVSLPSSSPLNSPTQTP